MVNGDEPVGSHTVPLLIHNWPLMFATVPAAVTGVLAGREAKLSHVPVVLLVGTFAGIAVP